MSNIPIARQHLQGIAQRLKDGTAERPQEFVKKAQEVFPGAQIDLNDDVPFAAEFR